MSQRLALPMKHYLPSRRPVPGFDEAAWCERNKPEGTNGCLLALAAVLGGFLGANLGAEPGLFLGGAAAPGLTAFVGHNIQTNQINDKLAGELRKHREATQKAEQDYQQTLETTIRTIARQTERDVATIAQVSNHIGELLEVAQSQFHAQAYGLMYESLASVAEYLDFLKQASQVIVENVEIYNGASRAYTGSVREPLRGVAIPSSGPLVQHSQELVMLAETTPTCTMIWEQKRTQRVIVEGFRGLSDAIYDLSYTVQSNMASLSDAIGSVNSSLAQSAWESSRSLEGVRDALEANRRETELGRKSFEQVKGWELGSGHHIRTKRQS